MYLPLSYQPESFHGLKSPALHLAPLNPWQPLIFLLFQLRLFQNVTYSQAPLVNGVCSEKCVLRQLCHFATVVEPTLHLGHMAVWKSPQNCTKQHKINQAQEKKMVQSRDTANRCVRPLWK